MRVAVLHPGQMGAEVGRALVDVGVEVVWLSQGRGEETRRRAEDAGLVAAGDFSGCDLVISVCPPGAAVEVAGSVAGFEGLYLDANAVSPATAAEVSAIVTAGGATYVDGGIIGPPPTERGTTRLYLSGERAGEVAQAFFDSRVDAVVVDAGPYAASATKMAYASWTKISAALLLSARETAAAYDVEDVLLAEWALSQPDLEARSEQAARSAAAKGWRWEAEMREIAATFGEAGHPRGFGDAAAEVFAATPARPPTDPTAGPHPDKPHDWDGLSPRIGGRSIPISAGDNRLTGEPGGKAGRVHVNDPDAAPPPGAPPTPRSPRELDVVAAEQRGLVTRRQCLAAGMSDKALEWRVVRKRWVAVHPGIYQTTPGREDWWTTALAGLLACGPQAAWSHDTAGHVYGIVAEPPRLVDVLVSHDHVTVARAGVRVRRSRHIDDRVDPMRWPWRTFVEETVLDLADEDSVDRMFAVLGRAFQRGLTTQDAVLHHLAGRARHSRRRLLGTVLEDVADGAESAMEVRYARDVERAHGLPRGVRQQPTDVGRLRWHDVGYRDQMVLIELDGRLGHEGRAARVSDGVRDRKSATTGWLTARAFWRDVTVLRCELAVDVGAILRSRGWAGTPEPCRRPGCAVRSRDVDGR